MAREIGKIKNRKVEIIRELDVPEHYFAREGRFSRAKMYEVRVEGLLRPIFIFLPEDRAKDSEVLKEVEIETQAEI